jgi:hypothetical protein
MSTIVSTNRRGALAGRLPIPWSTVVVVAVLMTLADTFWLVSIQGAVGAIERSQGPFGAWVRDCLVLLVPFVGVVLGTALIIAVFGTLLGVGAVAASSAYDYKLQTELLDTMLSTHSAALGLPAHPDHPTNDPNCDYRCRSLRDTRTIHLRGLAIAAPLILVSNVVLVGWVVAARGGRIGVTPTRSRQQRVPVSV